MILVDTCVVIWIAKEPQQLSHVAATSLAEARNNDGVAISCVTLYELAWLIQNDRVYMAQSLAAFLAQVEARFIVLPITASIAQLAAEFSAPYPSDPMDRLIGATALDHGIPLVTRDKAIRNSKAVSVIW